MEINLTYPDQVRGAVGAAIVNPVSDECSKSNDTALDTDEQAAVGRARAFRLIRWNGTSVDAIADTSDNSANNELRLRSRARDSRHLDDHTQDHDEATKSDCAAATNLIAVNQLEDGTKKATDFVDARYLNSC